MNVVDNCEIIKAFGLSGVTDEDERVPLLVIRLVNAIFVVGANEPYMGDDSKRIAVAACEELKLVTRAGSVTRKGFRFLLQCEKLWMLP